MGKISAADKMRMRRCVWALNCLRGCQCWSLRGSAVTLSISMSAFSSQHQQKPALFSATHILPKKNQRVISWNLENIYPR